MHYGLQSLVPSNKRARPVTKDDLVAAGFKYKMDLISMKQDTRMYPKDEHLDSFSRYTYSVASMHDSFVRAVVLVVRYVTYRDLVDAVGAELERRPKVFMAA